MIKITKNTFFKIIDIENNDIRIDDKILPLTHSDIKEFLVGKTFFYKVFNNQKLLQIHHNLNKFLNKIEINSAATGFIKEYSYLDFFEPHRKSYLFLRLDIQSFFHSIEESYIRKIFRPYITSDLKNIKEKEIEIEEVLTSFINIVTYKIHSDSKNDKFVNKCVLPMGFATSPVISNIIFRNLDILIQKVCSSNNIIYTRYADDMLFSSDKNMTYIHSESFINDLRVIIARMNFSLNERKTIKSNHTISLNGYTLQYSIFEDDFEMNPFEPTKLKKEKVINEFRLSNKKTKIINKLIFMINNNFESQKILKKLFNMKSSTNANNLLLNKLTGYRSYLISIIQFNKKFSCTRDITIIKYIHLVRDIENLINNLAEQD